MKPTSILFALAITAIGLNTAQAAAIIPAFDTFGSLPAANFGGSGIPNNAVAITTIATPNGTITLGLTATPRFSSPPVTNDGAGTFQADAGSYPSLPAYGLWNFSFYVATTGSVSGYTTQLFYDTNPAVGNDASSFPATPTGNFQDSWNLGMGFIGDTQGIDFDPSASGQYSFALVVNGPTGAEAGRSAINVNVGTVPDGGTTLLLLGSALGVMGCVKRKMGR